MIFSFFLKYFSHISPVIALNVFSTWIIAKIQLAGWYLLKEFQDELNPKETFTKKVQLFFFIIPRQRFSHFRKLLPNPELKEISSFPNSPIYSVNFFRSIALLSHFWCPVVNLVTFSSNFSNFKKNPKSQEKNKEKTKNTISRKNLNN